MTCFFRQPPSFSVSCRALYQPAFSAILRSICFLLILWWCIDVPSMARWRIIHDTTVVFRFYFIFRSVISFYHGVSCVSLMARWCVYDTVSFLFIYSLRLRTMESSLLPPLTRTGRCTRRFSSRWPSLEPWRSEVRLNLFVCFSEI